MIAEISTKDSYRLLTTVTESGAPKDMTGATVVAMASNGAAATAVDMSQASLGIIGVFWAAETFSEGTHELQVRATKGGDTRTIAREYVRAFAST